MLDFGLQQQLEGVGWHLAHLAHEVWDDPVEGAALVVQGLAHFAHSPLA